MLKEISCQQVSTEAEDKEEMTPQIAPRRILGANETPIDLLDSALRRWIRVIKPSRASLTYERME